MFGNISLFFFSFPATNQYKSMTILNKELIMSSTRTICKYWKLCVMYYYILPVFVGIKFINDWTMIIWWLFSTIYIFFQIDLCVLEFLFVMIFFKMHMFWRNLFIFLSWWWNITYLHIFIIVRFVIHYVHKISLAF